MSLSGSLFRRSTTKLQNSLNSMASLVSDDSPSNPASWSASDVEAWARQVGLSEATITNLNENEIDGPTLVTLEKEELRSELNIISLPARRYLWDLILSLRSYQGSTDRTTAIDVHEEEIDALPLQGYADASAGGDMGTDEEVVNQLRGDAAQERQIIADHLLALRLQSTWGQQTYEDSEMAHAEEDRLRQLAIQSEFDHRYAQSLNRRAPGRQGSSEDSRAQVASLFGLSIQACVSNRVNVAEALERGDIKVIPRLQDVTNNPDEEVEEIDLDARQNFFDSLSVVTQCHVCMEENKRGFVLGCDHEMCTDCTRNLFLAAVRDSSLLPLRCCEVPIDMNMCRHLITSDEVRTLMSRVAELEATNKMYCPTCNKFINLDLVDAQESTDLLCVCETALCVRCKTVAHPRFTCEENQAIVAGDDTLLLEHARTQGWKQCPNCSVMIELTYGCNHITCASCRFEFCFTCLSAWGGNQCSTGQCEVWDEDRLIAAGEARVDAEDNARQRPLPAAHRQERVQRAMNALRENEGCQHNWVRRTSARYGNCERCDYYLPCYGMVCTSDWKVRVSVVHHVYSCAQYAVLVIWSLLRPWIPYLIASVN